MTVDPTADDPLRRYAPQRSGETELDWGPARRFDSDRLRHSLEKVRTSTVDAWPLLAVGIGAIIMAIGGVLLWPSLTAPAAAGEPPIAAPSPTADQPATASASSDVTDPLAAPKHDERVPDPGILVHVAGQVRRPGVVELSVGDRVVDAIKASGGTLPNAQVHLVNLAAPVVDGEQILVPAPDHRPHESASATTRPAAEHGVTSERPAAEGGIDRAAVDALQAELQVLMSDRESAPPLEHIQEMLDAVGIGLPPELSAEIRALHGAVGSPGVEEP